MRKIQRRYRLLSSPYLQNLMYIPIGIMIYVALVEMIAEDFKVKAIATNTFLKIKMFVALLVGVLFMAILGIYA